MFRVMKEFKFEGAHRLTSSYSKRCQHIHGHSYLVQVFLTSAKLNEDGMVMDFKQMKDIGIECIVDQFDHALILHVDDDSAVAHEARNEHVENDARFIDFPVNPTAENMAKYFFLQFEGLVPSDVVLEKVRVWETKTAWAEYCAK